MAREWEETQQPGKWLNPHSQQQLPSRTQILRQKLPLTARLALAARQFPRPLQMVLRELRGFGIQRLRVRRQLALLARRQQHQPRLRQELQQQEVW